jgi:hypothetical protein
VVESTDVAPPAGASVVLSTVSVAVPVLVDGTGPGTSAPARTEMLAVTAHVFNAASPTYGMPVWYGAFDDTSTTRGGAA